MKHSQNLKLALATLMVIAIFSENATAAPTAHVDCSKMTVLEVENGAGVRFDSTCTTAYVLPPKSGLYQLEVVQNMKTKLCPSFESSYGTLDKMRAQHKLATEKLSQSPNDQNLVKYIQNLEQSMTLAEGSMSLFDLKNGITVGVFNNLLKWNQLVEDYKKANPNINFVRMPIATLNLSITRKTTSEHSALSSIVDHTVIGIQNNTDKLVSDNFQVQVFFNYAGICPLVKKDGLGIDTTPATTNKYLDVRINYSYNLSGEEPGLLISENGFSVLTAQ